MGRSWLIIEFPKHSTFLSLSNLRLAFSFWSDTYSPNTKVDRYFCIKRWIRLKSESAQPIFPNYYSKSKNCNIFFCWLSHKLRTDLWRWICFSTYKWEQLISGNESLINILISIDNTLRYQYQSLTYILMPINNTLQPKKELDTLWWMKMLLKIKSSRKQWLDVWYPFLDLQAERLIIW